MPHRKFVNFSDICVTVYVRQQLSEERLRLFADLYTSSASGTIPPILVTEDNKLIDGRHRMAALRFLGETGCVCEIQACKDSFELTIAALKANVGGSKELTMADVRQTIIRLMDNGATNKKIAAALPFPKELSRKLVKVAWDMRNTQRSTLAARDVEVNKITVDEATKKYGVSTQSIEKAKVKIQKAEKDQGELSNVGSCKGAITGKYYNMTTRMGNYFKKLAERYESGDFTEAQVLEILAHVNHQARGHANAMSDWNDRFSVMLRTRRPLIVSPLPNRKLEMTDTL